MGSVVLHVGGRAAAGDRADTADLLRSQGFAVATVLGLGEAVAAVGLVDPDVVVVDAGTGDEAVEASRYLRPAVETPIVVVLRDGVDRFGNGHPDPVVAALDAGSDDVIVELDRRRELVARVRAVIRRSERMIATGIDQRAADVYECGAIRLDDAQHVVTLDGDEVRLPLRQYQLLRVLLAHAGQVVARDALIDAVWGSSLDPTSKTLNVHVKRLRAQLEEDRRRPSRIVTVRGVGYRLTDGSARSPGATTPRSPAAGRG